MRDLKANTTGSVRTRGGVAVRIDAALHPPSAPPRQSCECGRAQQGNSGQGAVAAPSTQSKRQRVSAHSWSGGGIPRQVVAEPWPKR